MKNKESYLTVSLLNNYIEKKYKYDPYLREIYVKGEISNCKLHSNGNFYFTLKDKQTKIDATKFNSSDVEHLKEGDTVYIKATLNFLSTFGQQRLTVHEIDVDSVGDLYKKLIEIRNKLSKEGLFDSKYKKSIKQFNNNIAVVTSETGAAIQDIKRTILRRYPIANIKVYSSLVQGQNAIKDIVKNLELADFEKNDVIILARGGGSIEDLWSFNSEEVVRSVFNCNTPVVTGVGHETDTTLVDYVSDIRASTPTAAAEVVTPYTIENLKQYISSTQVELQNKLYSKISNSRLILNNLENNYYIKNFGDNYTKQKNLIQNYGNRLDLIIKNKLAICKQYVETERYKYINTNFLRVLENKFKFLVSNLENNSPLSILSKGYSITYDKNNKRINSIKSIKKNDMLTVQLEDGTITTVVTDISLERFSDDKK